MKKKLLIITGCLLLLIVSVIFVTGNTNATEIKNELTLGNKYYEDGKYQEAILAFQGVIKIDAKNIDARVGLVKVYVKINNPVEATKYAKEAVNIDVKDPQGYLKIAKAYIDVDNLTEAIGILTNGYKETNDIEIKKMLDDLVSKANLEGTNIGEDTNTTKPVPVHLNPKKVNDKWGYDDGKGNMVIEAQFEEVGSFGDAGPEQLAPVSVNGKIGYIDKTGKIIIAPKFDVRNHVDEGNNNFSEGLAAMTKDEKWGFIDSLGNFVIQPQFDEVNVPDRTGESLGDGSDGNFYRPKFSGGVANVIKDGKYVFIDKLGNFLFQPKFLVLSPILSDGLAIAQIKGDGKYGYVDKTGNFVIKPQFSWGKKYFEKDFINGLAIASTDGIKFGYIDKTGKFAIPPQFDEVQPFYGDTAEVKKDGNTFEIDNIGNVK